MDPIEHRMIEAIRSGKKEAEDVQRRLVYADWLETRGDIRAEFVRIDLAMRTLDPDHPAWTRAEDELSRIRVQCEPAWVEAIEAIEASGTSSGSVCACLGRRGGTARTVCAVAISSIAASTGRGSTAWTPPT